jgi:alpha-D-ribose 1-methylphosphonate 5-triphosphate synthase subunit PhnL
MELIREQLKAVVGMLAILHDLHVRVALADRLIDVAALR